MAYLPNIPLSTDQLSVSQGQIQGNFQALAPLVNGIINFPTSAGLPTPTGYNIMFANTNAVTGNSELYIQNQNNTQNTPFTASKQANTGWTYLPSGILMKWGYPVVSLPNPVTITYDPASPPFSVVFSVIATPVSAEPAVDPNKFITVDQNSVFANTDFFQAWASPRVTLGTATINIFYLAIGIGVG